MPVQIDYRSYQPKAEFIEMVTERFSAVANQDYLNQCSERPCFRPGFGEAERRVDAALETLVSRAASSNGMQFIRYLPDVTFLRISTALPEYDMAYTLIRTKRWIA